MKRKSTFTLTYLFVVISITTILTAAAPDRTPTEKVRLVKTEACSATTPPTSGAWCSRTSSPAAKPSFACPARLSGDPTRLDVGESFPME